MMMKRTSREHPPYVRLGLVASSMAAVALTACEGPNQFTGPGGGGGGAGAPSVQIVEVRSSLPVGDSLRVRARASDDGGVVGMTLIGRTVRGDPSLGTDETVVTFEERTVSFADPVRDTTITRFLQATEDQLRETTWVVIQAVDESGNVSQDSVSVVVGGPAVEFVNLAAPQSGTDLPIHVDASDPQGISSIQVRVVGVMDTTLVREFSPSRDTVALDTLLFIPSGLEGSIDVTATAVNTRGISGSTADQSLSISQQGSQDDTPPSLVMDADAPARLEASSDLQITLTGNDNAGGSGIRTAGITVLAISQARRDTLLRDSVVSFDRPRSGTVSPTFSFRPFNVDSLSLPDTLIFEVTGYFVDDAGNCAAVTSETGQASLPCQNVTVGGETGVVAESLSGLRLDREIVAGHTVLLPAGGRIMDAAVDTLRGNLFLSNIDRNRVEVFRLATRRFGNAIAVGSEPWGLDMVTDHSVPDPDSLVVANSNGTNLEMIDLDREEARPNERYFFPDVVIFDVAVEDGDNGLNVEVTPRPQLALLDFSDRPQYLAVDTFGNRVFSTVVAEGAPEVGTVRKSFFLEGWEQPETKIFVEHAIFSQEEDRYAFAHLDDMGGSGSVITMVDHRPGFPDEVFSVTADLHVTPLHEAVAEMRALGSDVFWTNGTWNVESLGFRDTTYVSASGDGTLVAIGEGATPDLGRVLLYRAARADTTALSGNVPVADLLTNRPEPVRGIGLNYDGTLGVVRGSSEVAFFDAGLRKQGGTTTFGIEGNGAALHPLHANQKTLQNLGGFHIPDVHLAFVGTGEGAIDVIDTFRFLRIGSLRIRDRVTGPIRAVLPFPGDNAGRQCSTVPVQDRRGMMIGEAVQLYLGGQFNVPASEAVTEDGCVVVKLFATTEAGGVVMVDVRKVDILRHHPER